MHRSVKLRQVYHIVGRIAELRFRKRPSGPVGEGVDLLQLNTAFRVHEGGVTDLLGVAEQGRGDLRVEHRLGQHADFPVQDLEILPRCMKELHDGSFSSSSASTPRSSTANGSTMTVSSSVAHLEQAKAGIIGLLAQELGIDCQNARRFRTIDKRHEFVLVCYVQGTSFVFSHSV